MWFLRIVDGHVSPPPVAMKLNLLDIKTIIQWHLTFLTLLIEVMYEAAN